MRKKIVHEEYPWPENKPEGLRGVVDFLPKPEDLVFRVKTTPITVPISEKSLAFYQKYAKKHNIAFESMLCAVLDAYAEKIQPGK